MATSTIRPRAVRAVWLRANTGKSNLRQSSISRSRAFDDDARDAAHLRADGQIAAPGRGVEPGALLHDDNVAGRCRFNRGGAEMARVRPAFGAIQLHGEHSAGDALFGENSDASR